MTGNTHVIGGVTVAAACMAVQQPIPDMSESPVMNVIFQGAWVACCVFGSLLPDIDQPTATLGRRLGPVSVFINKVCGHRNFFHSLLFLGLIYLTFYFLLPAYTWAGIGIFLGGMSHLILDALNHTGVALFWPIKKKFSVASIELHSLEELVVNMMLGLGLLYSLYVMYCSVR